MTLTKEEVKHIALLARVGLKDEEVEKYQKDLSIVLDFFRELETVSTESVSPIGHITGMMDRARTDHTENFDETKKDKLKNNVPEMKDGFIKVKSVF